MAAQGPEGTKVWVLHVLEPPSTVLGREMGGYEPRSEVLWEARREQAETLVAKAAELRDSGLNATPILKEGNPKSSIIDLATEWRADLIVLGSHRRKGLNRFLLGSVSEAVAGTRRVGTVARLPKESTDLRSAPTKSATLAPLRKPEWRRLIAGEDRPPEKGIPQHGHRLASSGASLLGAGIRPMVWSRRRRTLRTSGHASMRLSPEPRAFFPRLHNSFGCESTVVESLVSGDQTHLDIP